MLPRITPNLSHPRHIALKTPYTSSSNNPLFPAELNLGKSPTAKAIPLLNT